MRYLWFGIVLCLMQSLSAQAINSDTTMVINGETYTYAQIENYIMNDGKLIDLMTEEQMRQIDSYLAQILAQEKAKQQQQLDQDISQLDQDISQLDQSIAQENAKQQQLDQDIASGQLLILIGKASMMMMDIALHKPIEDASPT